MAFVIGGYIALFWDEHGKVVLSCDSYHASNTPSSTLTTSPNGHPY